MEEDQHVLMEVISPALDVQMKPNQSVLMEHLTHHVLMEINQFVQMELYFRDLLVEMETNQFVQMDPIPRSQGDLTVMMVGSLCVLMVTALYVLMELKLHLVRMEISPSVWMKANHCALTGPVP